MHILNCERNSNGARFQIRFSIRTYNSTTPYLSDPTETHDKIESERKKILKNNYYLSSVTDFQLQKKKKLVPLLYGSLKLLSVSCGIRQHCIQYIPPPGRARRDTFQSTRTIFIKVNKYVDFSKTKFSNIKIKWIFLWNFINIMR